MESMDYNNVALSPSWLTEETEQDFCYGAKATTSQLHPVYQTPPSSSFSTSERSPEWMELSEDLNDLGILNNFDDVTLSEGLQLGLGHNFNDVALQLGVEDFMLKTDEPSVWSSWELPTTTTQRLPPPKVTTIKLKKVKHTRTPKLSQRSFPRHSNLELQLVDPPPSQNYLLEQISSPESFFDNLQTENHNMTLEEVLSSGDAEKLLDSLLLDTSSGESIEPSLEVFPSDPLNEFEPLEFELNSSVNADSTMKFDVDLSRIEFEVDSTTTVESGFEFEVDSSMAVVSPFSRDSSSLEAHSPWSSPSSSEPEVSSRKNKKPKTQRKNHSPEYRHLRKKEQNKEAALRYRNKKREEDQKLAREVRAAELAQEELKEQQAEVRKDISFMKKLLREAFQAKNLLPK